MIRRFAGSWSNQRWYDRARALDMHSQHAVATAPLRLCDNTHTHTTKRKQLAVGCRDPEHPALGARCVPQPNMSGLFWR